MYYIENVKPDDILTTHISQKGYIRSWNAIKQARKLKGEYPEWIWTVYYSSSNDPFDHEMIKIFEI